MVPVRFIRWSGGALAFAGVLTAAINLFLTSRVTAGRPAAEVTASTVFLFRQGASCLAVLLLLAGSTGLYLRQAGRIGVAGAVAFGVAWAGSALTMAFEWAEALLLHTVALRAPSAIPALDVGKGPSPYDLGAIVAAATFALGWLAFAIVTWRAAVLPRAASLLVIAGLFGIPLLQAALHVWGAIAGNVVLGTGWLALGAALWRTPSAPTPTPV